MQKYATMDNKINKITSCKTESKLYRFTSPVAGRYLGGWIELEVTPELEYPVMVIRAEDALHACQVPTGRTLKPEVTVVGVVPVRLKSAEMDER